MQQISPAALKAKLTASEDIQLIDVREISEHEIFHIGGELIPLPDLMASIGRIAVDRPVVIYCEKGIRSRIAIQRLENKFKFNNLINLKGGMEAWREEMI
jgi:adenylyltransferase/sulfurtransferase